MNDSQRLAQARAHFFSADKAFIDTCIRGAKLPISTQEDWNCSRLEQERNAAAFGYAKELSATGSTSECARLYRDASVACGNSQRDLYALVVHRIVWPSNKSCKTAVEKAVNCAKNELLNNGKIPKQRS